MNRQASRLFRKFFHVFTVVAALSCAANATKLSPTLQNQLNTLADNASVGMAIVTFNTIRRAAGTEIRAEHDVNRATLATKLNDFSQLFTTGG